MLRRVERGLFGTGAEYRVTVAVIFAVEAFGYSSMAWLCMYTADVCWYDPVLSITAVYAADGIR